MFYGIGHTPNTEFLDGTGVERDEEGYVVTLPDEAGRMTGNTDVEGVFAAGDAADPTYRQAITPAGTGSMAVLDVEAYLETLEIGDRTEVDASA